MIDNFLLLYTAIVSLAYLLGSIPFGIVLGKLFKVGDIRAIGSGSIGATNALRTGNKSFAICVLLGDLLKGVLAVQLAWHVPFDWYANPAHNSFEYVTMGATLAGIAAMIGHIFPVWLRFKGGKGVATGAGIVTALHWPTGILCIVMWLVVARLSRYSSLAAILVALHLPIYAVASGGQAFTLPFALMALLLFWAHRANLRRLLKGEEPTITLKKNVN